MPISDLLRPFLNIPVSRQIVEARAAPPTDAHPSGNDALIVESPVAAIEGAASNLSELQILQNRCRTAPARTARLLKRQRRKLEAQAEQNETTEPIVGSDILQFLTPDWKKLSSGENGKRRRSQTKALWSHLCGSYTVTSGNV